MPVVQLIEIFCISVAREVDLPKSRDMRDALEGHKES